MGITSSTPDVPGAVGTEREEGRSSLAPPNGGPTANGTQRVRVVSEARTEEDWVAMATGDPAFWLKD